MSFGNRLPPGTVAERLRRAARESRERQAKAAQNGKTTSKTTSTKSRLETIAERFEGFCRCGEGYKAQCPAHDDTNPSLSVNEGENGRIVIHCHAGCETAAILDAVGLTFKDLGPTDDSEPKIVATYDYRDESGKLLFQVVRFDPKDFRQRRPDGSGGWIWSVRGVRRVPYRLPELLAADPTEPVFVVEGEKDVDNLFRIGLPATCNAGGAGKWTAEDAQYLAGRPVIVLRDNDESGLKHRDKVAASLENAESVRILELPGLPPKGDVSDWLAAGGTRDELLDLANNVPTESNVQEDEQTAEPLGKQNDPLGSNSTDKTPDSSRKTTKNTRSVDSLGTLDTPVAEFPIDAFPRPLQQFIRSIAEALPCPPDFPGSMILPVLATLIGRKRCIEISPTWHEHAILWGAVVARSGDRKTPAFEKVTAPLRRIQRRLHDDHVKELEAWKADKDEDKGPRPQLKQVITTDTTIEALKRILVNNPSGIIFTADELSGWARSMCQYKGGRGNDRQHWLSIWSGTQIVCNRVSLADPIIIDDPFVCITGGIQPDALDDLIDSSREDGFAAR